MVLIVIDTFGVEHAGGFMNTGLAHTPQMDRLAARGVVFRRAYAPSPWTQPSVATMLTGVMPVRHGMRKVTDRMRPELPTLGQRLKERGYATGAVISNYLLLRRFGFARGFDSFETSPEGGHEAITSHLVTDHAIRFAEANASGRFFLLAHYFDPHYDYRHHAEFDQTSGYRGSLKPGMSIWDLRNRRASLSRADVDYLVGLHREEIAYTDAHIGRLLDRLDQLGLRERTLIVLTADHGEEFMRHGWIGHTRTLYEELLRVPLIVSLPGVIPPGTVDEPVSLTDVMPTILALCGATAAVPDGAGISLAPRLLLGEALEPERKIFGEVSFVPLSTEVEARETIAFKTSLLWGQHKLIHDLPSGGWELFDLAADPEELANLSGQRRPAEAQLAAELENWEAARGATNGAASPDPVPLDAHEIERLRSLGYIR